MSKNVIGAASVAAMLAAGALAAPAPAVSIARARPTRLFVPLTRKDPATREVEGYCYVNAKVGDGWNLKRSAMEKASEDYMKFGAIREMHGSSAAGTALGVTWDDNGCLLRAKIVDDAAWKKVEEGVYKGFSVGVLPQVVRGADVDVCQWVENSLVDRPFDADATFTSISRAQGFETDAALDAEYDVTILPADVPGPDDLAAVERLLDGAMAGATVEGEDVILRLSHKKLKKSVKMIGKVKAALSMGGLYYAAQPTLTRQTPAPAPGSGGTGTATPPEGDPAMSDQTASAALEARVQTLEGHITRMTQTNQALTETLAKSEKKRLKAIARAAAAEAQAGQLAGLPVPTTKRPVVYAGAPNGQAPVERQFAANQVAEGDGEAAQAALAHYKARESALMASTDPAVRFEGAAELSLLSGQLQAEYGLLV